MALGRQVEISIGPGDGISLVTGWSPTIISELDCSFNIVRNVLPSENKCNLKVYNMSLDTRNNLLKEDNNLIIKAGYADERNLGIIFAGNIDESFTRVEGPDIVSEISAVSYRGKDKNSESVWASFTYGKEIPFSKVVQDVATSMGLTVIGSENLVGVKLPNGFASAGSYQHTMNYIRNIAYNNKIATHVDGSVLYIYYNGIPTKVSTVILESGGSLLKIEETKQSKSRKKLASNNDKSKKELTVTCLLDPKIVPSEGIYIKDPQHEGAYFVREVNFFGDNFAGDFNCIVKVESID